MATLKTCPVCGKEHKRPKYCSLEHQLQANREWRAKNAKRYREKYKGCYRTPYTRSPNPLREMCKCPNCQVKFLGSPWQGKHSYCESCLRMVRGINSDSYRIGSGWATGYNEGGNYYA
jgi:hypothetical protein